MSTHENWSSQYAELVNRNIGLLEESQQERLRRAKVSVPGAGGIGGVAFEVLVRSGVGAFSVVDKDVFEPTNMNRQIFSFRHTVGRRKIDVAEEFARAINPDVRIDTFDHVDEANVEQVLAGCEAVVLSIDQLRPCVVLARQARRMNIPIIEGWALPYGNVRVLTADTPSLEEVYNLPTAGLDLRQFSDGDFEQLRMQFFASLARIEDLPGYYNERAIANIARGHITSFAPMVWLTSVLMALETVKVLLNWGQPAQGPAMALYDPFRHRIPKVA